MDSCNFKSLLPDNATDLERSIEQVMHQKYCNADVKIIAALSDPMTCPAEFLTWLAFAKSVDRWNDRWPEATKRAVIANAKLLHKVKGTEEGVADALAALGVNMTMTSWEDMSPEGEVGTASFDLLLNHNFNPDAAVMIDAELIQDIDQTIKAHKRLSVHYTFNIGIKMTFVGMALASSVQLSTFNQIGVNDDKAALKSKPAAFGIATSAQLSSLSALSIADDSASLKVVPAGYGIAFSAATTTLTTMSMTL